MNDARELAERFWETPLDELTSSALQSRSESSLPVKLDHRVPPEGSVLLRKSLRLEEAEESHRQREHQWQAIQRLIS